MKRLIAMAIVALTAIEFVSAAPTVTDITAKQRYPWNGLVDITCKVSGIEADAGGYEFAVVAVNKETGREYTVSNFSIQHNGEEVSDVCANGDYSLLWNAREDMGQVVIERMTVRITLEALAASVGKVQLWEGGPYWADRNIGAKKPEDSGLYFWWGDTVGHPLSGGRFDFSFTESNCPTYAKTTNQIRNEGWITSSNWVLAPSHDAAHVKWGGGWHMPTRQEFEALNNECDWTWTTMNGVNGYIVSGRGNYASNCIFLPCTGYAHGKLLGSTSFGVFLSSEANSDYGNGSYAYHLSIESSRYGVGRNYRYLGKPIRPVQ